MMKKPQAQKGDAAGATGCRHAYQDVGVVRCSTSHKVMTSRIVRSFTLKLFYSHSPMVSLV